MANFQLTPIVLIALLSMSPALAQFSGEIQYGDGSVAVFKPVDLPEEPQPAPSVGQPQKIILTAETPIFADPSPIRLFGYAQRMGGTVLQTAPGSLIRIRQDKTPNASVRLSLLRMVAALDAVHQRSLAEQAGTYMPPLNPLPHKSPSEIDGEMKAQFDRAKAAWSGLYLEPGDGKPPQSPEQINAALEAQSDRAKAEWAASNVEAQSLPPVRSPQEIQDQLQAQFKRSQKTWAGLSSDSAAPQSLPSPDEVAAQMDSQMQKAKTIWLGMHLEPAASSAGDGDPQTTGTFSMNSRDSNKVLSWDEWYARMADLITVPLVQALEKYGNPAGYAKIRLTVWPNHQLKAELETGSGNTTFSTAVLEAYQSLNGDPTLEFPLGSRRTVVAYDAENWHDTPGAASGVHSQPLRGDQEFIHITSQPKTAW